jgi:hypothetical protein
MHVRLTQIDGKLPNLALMKLAHWHRARGDTVRLTKNVERSPGEPAYGRVYGSAIFSFSAERVAAFREHFPEAVVGGTHNVLDNRTVEEILGVGEYEHYDYSIYGDTFTGSLGFTQRGCRLKCGFCVVPKKEGRPRAVNTIADIWRGAPWPKHLHLLDNDFFGQPREQWQARVQEIRTGGFKVCFNQGINIRMIDDESAAALASIPLFDDSFTRRRLYTAWDNLGDEERFFRGVDTLERHGISPRSLMVYMLVGYDRRETWERVLYRFDRMVEHGIRPYPMAYGDRTRQLEPDHPTLGHRTLTDLQRWAIRRYYRVTSFADYDTSVRSSTTVSRRCRRCSRALSAHARAGARYCSSTCRAIHWRHRARVAQRLARKRRCWSCGISIARGVRGDAQFCSGRCRQRGHRVRRLLRGEDSGGSL